jgi:DNA-binding LacI/PurR family transcriptional regulator
MALFGSFWDVLIAGTGVRKSPIMSDLVHRLVALGHQRICMLSHRERLLPDLALYELNFLKALADCGIATSSFHLPVWEPSREGLHQCVDTLFQHTPPTALIIEEAQHLIAVRHYLSSKGIHSPQHISLICSDSDPSFTWCEPPVTHMSWNLQKLVNHVVRWANHLANGKAGRGQRLLNAELVEGGTIGPPPR